MELGEDIELFCVVQDFCLVTVGIWLVYGCLHYHIYALIGERVFFHFQVKKYSLSAGWWFKPSRRQDSIASW